MIKTSPSGFTLAESRYRLVDSHANWDKFGQFVYSLTLHTLNAYMQITCLISMNTNHWLLSKSGASPRIQAVSSDPFTGELRLGCEDGM